MKVEEIYYHFRTNDIASPEIVSIEDDLNLEELMKQKALLQARLGAYLSDGEMDESCSKTKSDKRMARDYTPPPKKNIPENYQVNNLNVSSKVNKQHPELIPEDQQHYRQRRQQQLQEIDDGDGDATATANSKHNLNKISKDKISNESDIILLDDSSGDRCTPVRTQTAKRERNSILKVRTDTKDDERNATTLATVSSKHNHGAYNSTSSNHQSQRHPILSRSEQKRSHKTSRSKSCDRDPMASSNNQLQRSKRRDSSIDGSHSRNRHRDNYDQNRQKEDLRQEINRDKLREKDHDRFLFARDGRQRRDDESRERYIRDPRDRERDREREREKARERDRDRNRKRDKWLRERSHSRSKAESDRKRERERNRLRGLGDNDYGRDRNSYRNYENKDGSKRRNRDRDCDQYRGSLSEGQTKRDKENSSDNDTDINLDINLDDEDDEEKIIEMRRKQREELLKVRFLFQFYEL